MDTEANFLPIQPSVWGGALLFAYTVLEASFCRIYKRSVEKCLARIMDATANYKVPEAVSKDITKQLSVMKHIKTFYRDLFEVRADRPL